MNVGNGGMVGGFVVGESGIHGNVTSVGGEENTTIDNDSILDYAQHLTKGMTNVIGTVIPL